MEKRGIYATGNPLSQIKIEAITPKEVALIACPWIFYDQAEFQSQQLGLGYIGAYARQFGHKIAAFIDPMMGGGDRQKEPLNIKQKNAYRFGFSDEWIVSQIPTTTDVIGINAPFTDSRLALYPLVRKIKSVFPQKIIVVGGVLANTLPNQILEESAADIAVRGEGEIAFSRILNGEPWEGIQGLVFRDPDGRIVDTGGLAEQFSNVNDLPLPGYDLRPMHEYVRLSTWGNRVNRTLHLITSRGCPFNCSFCSSPQKTQRWRAFSAERILEEIKMAIEKWGINFIEFADDNFTFEKKRAAAILEGVALLRESGHDLGCAFPNGVMIEKMDGDLAVLMKRAGVEMLYLPAESGDTRMLVAMNKPNALTHLQKTLEVAKYCVDAGLPVGCFLILAYPGGRVWNKNYLGEYKRFFFHEDNSGVYMQGEDEESFETSIKFCKKMQDIGARGVTPLIATPLPATEMHAFCKKFGFLAFDDKDSLVTVSYANVTADDVSLETPWCSRERAYERWRYIMGNFPTYHNVRKLDSSDSILLSGEEIRRK